MGNYKKACYGFFSFAKVSIALLSFVCLSVSYAQDSSQELEKLKDLIEQTQAQLSKNLADSERLQQELKLAELKIAETATLLNQTDQTLKATRADIAELKKEKEQLESQIETQQSALAEQVKSAYMAGDYDFAKMVFNQNQVSKLERVLTYYQYMNKERQAQIESFQALITSLTKVEARLSEQELELASLAKQQSTQSRTLSQQQQTRFETLKDLEKQIESDQAKVNRLLQQENSLLAAIEAAEVAAQAAKAQAEQTAPELSGLTPLKGKMQNPANGRVDRLFGKRRQGQVRWKGIVINARAGTPVTSVANGVVLYADWLKGFGLVTIVDHGEGYMSVYGRNQALLKNVGDFVREGETISLTGTSGGQTKSGLYFEIRHKGKALNPSAWLARS